MLNVLKNRNERKAIFLSKNALRQAKRQARKKCIATTAYLTLKAWKVLQIEAERNLFVFYKLQQLQAREIKKNQNKEVPVPYEVQMPVPMKCKFDLAMPPRVDTSNLQKLLDSSTATLKYSAELYQAIKKVPCLDFSKE